MNKPIILVEQEMKEELVGTVNKYSRELPMSMILSTLKELVSLCQSTAEQQLAEAQRAYQAELEAEQAEKEEEALEEATEEIVEESEDKTDG